MGANSASRQIPERELLLALRAHQERGILMDKGKGMVDLGRGREEIPGALGGELEGSSAQLPSHALQLPRTRVR